MNSQIQTLFLNTWGHNFDSCGFRENLLSHFNASYTKSAANKV